MRLIIRPEIFDTFDAPLAGVVVARGVENRGAPPGVAALMRAAEEEARKAFTGFASPGEHPRIAAWRKAYKKFGCDPHQYRCSAEALARRALKGDEVPRINTLVDIYNAISLRHVAPVGGEDIDTLDGDLELAFADGTEQFVRLGGAENEPPPAGEVVYRDRAGVICRRWNWREGDRTKLTEDTKNAVIVVDAVAPMGRAAVEEATNELARLIREHCGGEVVADVLDGERREVTL